MHDLLFLAHRIPYPPSKGDKIRAWHFLRHLAKRRRVHLGCFVDEDSDWAHVSVLKELAAETCCLPLSRARAVARCLPALLARQPLTLPYYYDARMAAWVDGVRLQRPLTVFVYCSSMAQYVMDGPSAPRVIDFVDVDSEKWRAYAQRRHWPLSAVYRREGRTLLETERRIARMFDASIFVSEAEAGVFRRLAPESAARVKTVSMGMDQQHYSPDAAYPDPYDGAGHSALCFTGMMDYWPNVDAVGWFVRSVLPVIRRARSSVTFWIVGANPSREVQKLAREPGVVVTGRVLDTRPYLAHAAAVVAPLQIARGIQTKVLEAMSMARPVIASAHAFEGLVAEEGRDLLVARSADEFVAAVERIWDRNFATALGVRARQAVERYYDWPQQLSVLDDIIARVEDKVGARLRAVVR